MKKGLLLFGEPNLHLLIKEGVKPATIISDFVKYLLARFTRKIESTVVVLR
jgi:hypothetical protein